MILSSHSGWPLRGILMVAAIALVPMIAGCEAGTNSPTQRWHQPTPGASAVVNNTIRLNNVFLLGAQPDSTLAQGSSAGLFLAVSNEGSPDTLVSVSAPGTAGSVRMPSGGIGIGSQQTVLLTGPVPRIVLEDLTRSLGGGQSVRVVLDFLKAGSVTLQVPVMPKAQYYSTYSPPPASPSPTATTAQRAAASPSAAPSSVAPTPATSTSPGG